MAFARALRQGQLERNGKALSGTSIETTLRECAQCMVNAGFRDPRKNDPGQTNLNKDISDYIRQCKLEDPAPLPELALPSSVVHFIAKSFLNTSFRRLWTIADLIIVAFFFLLRVGEYTPSSQPRQAVPLRKQDVTLWKAGTPLDNDLPVEDLLTADAVTICLANQKNGDRNTTVHHHSSGDPWVDPVKSMARLVHNLHGMPGSTPLGTYRHQDGSTKRIRSSDVLTTIRMGAKAAASRSAVMTFPASAPTASARAALCNSSSPVTTTT